MPRRSATNRSCRAIPKTGSVFLNAPLSLCAFILSHLPAFVKSRRDGIINERFGFPRGFLCFFHRTKIFITLCVGTERDGSGKFPFVHCRGGACPSRHCTGGKCGPMLKRQWPPSLSLRGRSAPVAISGRHSQPVQAAVKMEKAEIWGVAALTAQPLAALPPYGCGVPFTGSERRYRRNWCIPFSRRPVRIGSIAPSEACPSPTTRKQLPCTTPDFRQNVFDISGAGGYNKDVETQTVATNITYLFPICELDHSQISESSGCDRRLTFFLSEANRRSGRDAR